MKNESLIDLKLAKKLYDAYSKVKVANPDDQLSITQNVLGHDVEYIFNFFHPFNSDPDDGFCLEFWEYKTSKEADKFFENLNQLYSFNINDDDGVYAVERKLEKKLKTLFEAEHQINRHLHDIGISQAKFYACFHAPSKTTLLPWAVVSAALSNLRVAPKPIEVRLNKSYVANITANTGYIQVGCQSIPVDAIREALATYDNISTK